MILAAGRGERLRPLTDSIPKPLVQVGKYRLIEYHLFALARARVKRVVINVSYLGAQITAFLGDGGRYGIQISYSVEPKIPLGTAAGIQQALPLLDADKFIVVNADIWCDFAFESLQLSARSKLHLVLVDNPAHNPAGDFSLSVDSAANCRAGVTATLFARNDPAINKLHKSYTFAGIGVYHAAIFETLPTARYPLAPVIRHSIASGLASAQLFNGKWIDIGTLERLETARRQAPL